MNIFGDLFCGLFDFNGDGVTSTTEELLGWAAFNECFGNEDDENDEFKDIFGSGD